MKQQRLFDEPASDVPLTKWTRNGGVPGGHDVIWNGKGQPFVPPMKECHSIALRHSDVVVDIGAYCGTYAIRCARFPVKRVIAYEPTPATFEVLTRTKLPNLEMRQAAIVGDTRPTVTLYISSGIGVTNGITKSLRKANSIDVAAVSYAEAVRDATIVKIDVEGAEYGYPLIQPSLRALIIDFHPIVGNRQWHREAEQRIAEIEAAGFLPVVKPDFSCGWTQAGSWLRDLETTGECTEMMTGTVCCGCGAGIHAAAKALCSACWKLWKPAERRGFVCGESAAVEMTDEAAPDRAVALAPWES